MGKNKAPVLRPEDLTVLIECVHDRFMNVQSGAEPVHPRARGEVLTALSNLHARLELMLAEASDERPVVAERAHPGAACERCGSDDPQCICYAR